MDIDLSEEQEFFRDTTRKFLHAESPLSRVRELIDDTTGFDRETWAQGADLGWFSFLVPDEFGGGTLSGAPVTDLAIVAGELGRSMFPGPVLPSNLVASAIARSGSPGLRAEHLPSIVAGDTIATWAFAEANDRWDAEGIELAAVPEGEGFRLSGTKTVVQDAHVATLFLVSARTPRGLTQFLVPATSDGVGVEPLETLDVARRFSQIRFDNVAVDATAVVGQVDEAVDDIEYLGNLAVVLQCAESVGAAERTFEFTLEYAQDRKAFGRPIGGFQAIKHRFAEMLGWLESAKAATAGALEAVQRGVDATEITSIAKWHVGTHTTRVVRDCLQVHGGIGYTWEHDLHLYLRRVESNRAVLGSPEQHLDRLAAVLGI
jgi:alkylation response protein AidB-like acyl-CoA dehydrogenase